MTDIDIFTLICRVDLRWYFFRYSPLLRFCGPTGIIEVIWALTSVRQKEVGASEFSNYNRTTDGGGVKKFRSEFGSDLSWPTGELIYRLSLQTTNNEGCSLKGVTNFLEAKESNNILLAETCKYSLLTGKQMVIDWIVTSSIQTGKWRARHRFYVSPELERNII